MKTSRLVICLVCLGITASAQCQLVINELVASNSLLADDPDFEQSSDVVELYNSGAEALDLSGWHLTDNFNDTTKWTFPSGVTIGAGGFLLVWCDGENAEASHLHSSFKLSSIGEELAVYDASGMWVDGVVFPTQSADISYGRSTDAATEWAWFEAPTLGTSNNAATAFEGITHGIPYFSVEGGFYGEALSVELTALTGEIRYTTDGLSLIHI